VTPRIVREGSVAHWLLRALGLAAVIGVLLWIPIGGGITLAAQTTNALVLMGAAMALNLLLGYAGQLSLGHSAFFGIGAYTTGIAVARYGWSPWWTFPMAFLVAFVVGVLVSLPALRIKGIYLALVTLALAAVFPQIIKWRKLSWLTNGAVGLPNSNEGQVTTGFDFRREMRHFEIFGWDAFGDLRKLENKTVFFYWIAATVVIVVYLVCRGVVKSRAGRSLIAVRDNETAAAVMGVDLRATKGIVFGLSAGLCALPGSVTAIISGTVTVDTPYLTLIGSIIFLVVVVIGGAGTLWGPIVGAALYQFIVYRTGQWSHAGDIPALLRPLFSWSEVPVGNGIFAVALIVLMFVAPFGIVGLLRRLSARVVRVVPRPAGTGAPRAVAPAGTLGDQAIIHS
jgi:branched-chain amino acid transport system permease protein